MDNNNTTFESFPEQRSFSSLKSKIQKFILLILIWTIVYVLMSYGWKYKNYVLNHMSQMIWGKSTQKLEPSSEFKSVFPNQKHVTLSLRDLKQFTGIHDKKPILLGIKGRIYDVTRGKEHYGPDGGYHFFAGRDGSKSFVTGCFDDSDEKCTKNSHDYSDMSENDKKSIDDWVSFYDANYPYVGTILLQDK